MTTQLKMVCILSKVIKNNLKTIPAIILTDGYMVKAEITNNQALESLILPSYLKW
jgi:hypothetical protein